MNVTATQQQLVELCVRQFGIGEVYLLHGAREHRVEARRAGRVEVDVRRVDGRDPELRPGAPDHGGD